MSVSKFRRKGEAHRSLHNRRTPKRVKPQRCYRCGSVADTTFDGHPYCEHCYLEITENY